MTRNKEELVKKFAVLSNAGKRKGLSTEQLFVILRGRATHRPKSAKQPSDGKTLTGTSRIYLPGQIFFITVFCIGTSLAFLFFRYQKTVSEFGSNIQNTKCMLDHNDYTREIARPVANCVFCRNLTEVPREENLTASRFREKYAYSLIPALIKGETRLWDAVTKLDFQVLKELYETTEGALWASKYRCQFHPYKTELLTLEQAFNMSVERRTGKDGKEPWYIGWNNCHDGLREKLRKYFQKPSFLSEGCHMSVVDWMFMGTPGQGAATHLDYIQKPSWQAQLSGTKTWTLIPPPECQAECRVLHVTVHKGDILAVDTNVWYHNTFVEPGEISIGLGSEYD